MKLLKRFFPIIVFIFIFLFFYLRGKINDNKFYNSKINSKIVSKSKWLIRTTEYYLDNGLRIDSTPIYNISIEIGDSIVKKAKCWDFEVYRKDIEGNYFFDTNYNLINP